MVVETLDLSDALVAAQVLEVQRAAYRVEAELIGSTAIPQLHESLDELVAAPLQWRGIRIDRRIVAAMAFAQVDNNVDIDRLVVAPDQMRSGHGSALLDSLDSLATITVSTGTDNLPAHRFYMGHGFAVCGRSEPVVGLSVTHFQRGPE